MLQALQLRRAIEAEKGMFKQRMWQFIKDNIGTILAVCVAFLAGFLLRHFSRGSKEGFQTNTPAHPSEERGYKLYGCYVIKTTIESYEDIAKNGKTEQERNEYGSIVKFYKHTYDTLGCENFILKIGTPEGETPRESVPNVDPLGKAAKTLHG